MLLVEPQKPGEPRLQLYESIQELRKDTGQKVSHGYFDAANNTVVATLYSVAHELGHFHDYRSGKMKVIASIKNKTEKSSARIRNEIVAILYARSKVKAKEHFLDYEQEFLDWFLFNRASKTFGPHPEFEIENLKIEKIQEISDWVVLKDRPWLEKLRHIFRHYLLDEQPSLTYHRSPRCQRVRI